MNTERLGVFVAGLLTGLLLLAATGFTSAGQVSAVIAEVRYLIRGQELLPSDRPHLYDNGRAYVPAALNVQGTTYVPLRFAAEALGLQVHWDAGTETISIDQQADQPSPGVSEGWALQVLSRKDLPGEVAALLDYSVATELAQSYNFGGHTYLIVTRGVQPTGGYSVAIEQITETAAELIVDIGYGDPASGDVVTQALTYPYMVGMIPETLKPVHFQGLAAAYPPRLYGLDRMEPIAAESKAIKLFPATWDQDRLVVRGMARVFEGTVSWSVFDAADQVVKQGFVTAASGGPDWGYFDFPLPVEYLRRGYHLRVYEESAKDGQPLHVISLPVDQYADLLSSAAGRRSPLFAGRAGYDRRNGETPVVEGR